MGVFGLVLAMVGVEPVAGAARFTFNNVMFLNGIDFIPVAVGLFAIGEMLINAERTLNLEFGKFSLRSMIPTRLGSGGFWWGPGSGEG